MTLIEVENTYFFSSDEALGAQNISDKGSKFQILLDKAMEVPPSAVDCTIECRTANIWFVSPNIAEEYNNNKLYLSYNLQQFVLTIPDGLYSVSELNCTIQRLIADVPIPLPGGGSVPEVRFQKNSISLSTFLARSRVILKMITGLSFLTDLDLPNNIAFTLGFASQSGSAAKVSTYDGEYFEAENVARLTRINGYLLHGDIVNQGLSLNNSFSTILTEIQLSVGPGKLLTYNPYNPYKLDGNHLKFGPKSLFTFYLTDEKNRPIDTFEENFNFSLVI